MICKGIHVFYHSNISTVPRFGFDDKVDKDINVHFSGFSTQFQGCFHLYVNQRFILEEINNVLIGKTYVNKRFSIQRQRRSGSVERKSYNNGRLRLMRGLTVY